MQNAIVLITDRLGAAFLGPYGNAWLETPAFNRLAAESLLIEFMTADAPGLSSVYRSYLQGFHPLMLELPNAHRSVFQRAKEAGLSTRLLTDEPEVANHADTIDVDEVIDLSLIESDVSANDVTETQLARLFSAAIESLSSCREPFILWIHARAMAGPWDAPYEFREHFADDEDPPPPKFVIPPNRELVGDTDPDELLGFQQAYAAQVTVLDTCLGLLLDEFKAQPFADETLFLVSSPRGYPLGEHGIVGGAGDPLWTEHYHIPCLLRLPKMRMAARRTPQLCQPADINATLGNCLSLPNPVHPCWGTDILSRVDLQGRSAQNCVVGIAQGRRMIRTPAWMMRIDDDDRIELFAKPDDRWELNEVASRCRSEIAQLRIVLDEFAAAVKVGDRSRLNDLPVSLLERNE